MGTIQHHAIIITSWDQKRAEEFRAQAIEIARSISEDYGGGFARMISPVILSPVNGYATIFIAPDGSKEGWTPSREGDAFRAAILAEIPADLDWVEVGYGELGSSIREKKWDA